MVSLPYLFSRPFTIEWLQVSATQCLRVLVHKAPGVGRPRKLRPLHVNIHAGAFIGGVPETTAKLDQRIAIETGAVVVSLSHRLAPENVFPAAIDDVDAAIKYIQDNAVERWGADPTLLTVGGLSAGANLALAATQQEACHAPALTAIKASVTFYAPVDLRLRPDEKPKSGNFPETDPLAVLIPLYDAYAAPARQEHMNNPRLSPTLAARETLPERMLMIVPEIDIIVVEQLAFAERINGEDERAGRTDKPRIEIMYEKDLFHGFLEGELSMAFLEFYTDCLVPDMVVKKEVKDRIIDRAVEVLKETHEKYGWKWEG